MAAIGTKQEGAMQLSNGGYEVEFLQMGVHKASKKLFSLF
jgi:hypothetical protein